MDPTAAAMELGQRVWPALPSPEAQAPAVGAHSVFGRQHEGAGTAASGTRWSATMDTMGQVIQAAHFRCSEPIRPWLTGALLTRP